MATNHYFQSGLTPGTTSEQRFLEDVIIESIKIYGHDVQYIPRVSAKPDSILGEDVLSHFDASYPVEMYLTNIDGWEGDGELFSKFGIQVNHQATFVVSKRRWEDVVGSNTGLQLLNRPAEGDLIYFPMTNSVFEIKFVQHLDPFYQLGKFHIFSMQCELFQSSSETFDTGIVDLDDSETQDAFTYQMLLETGDFLLTEDGFSIIQETYGTSASVPFSDNAEFRTSGSDILDFSTQNPFGEI